MNTSDLESLPYDVFALMIETGQINNENLLRLCNSSSILNKMCNKNNQLIFKKALKRTYGIENFSLKMKPRDFLKLFKFSSINDVYNSFEPHRIGMKFFIPDVIIEKFAISLGVTLDDLLLSPTFISILQQHLFISQTPNPNMFTIGVTNIEGDLPKSIDKIPIFWTTTSEYGATPEKPTYMIYGIILLDGQLKELKQEFFMREYMIVLDDDCELLDDEPMELLTSFERVTQISKASKRGTLLIFKAEPGVSGYVHVIDIATNDFPIRAEFTKITHEEDIDTLEEDLRIMVNNLGLNEDDIEEYENSIDDLFSGERNCITFSQSLRKIYYIHVDTPFDEE